MDIALGAVLIVGGVILLFCSLYETGEKYDAVARMTILMFVGTVLILLGLAYLYVTGNISFLTEWRSRLSPK